MQGSDIHVCMILMHNPDQYPTQTVLKNIKTIWLLYTVFTCLELWYNTKVSFNCSLKTYTETNDSTTEQRVKKRKRKVKEPHIWMKDGRVQWDKCMAGCRHIWHPTLMGIDKHLMLNIHAAFLSSMQNFSA